MSLNPRAIATQGLGFSSRLVAVQGLWPVADSAVGGGGFRQRQRVAWRTNDDDEVLLLIAAAVAAMDL